MELDPRHGVPCGEGSAAYEPLAAISGRSSVISRALTGGTPFFRWGFFFCESNPIAQHFRISTIEASDLFPRKNVPAREYSLLCGVRFRAAKRR